MENLDIFKQLKYICDKCSRGRVFGGLPCQFLKSDKHCQEYDILEQYILKGIKND